jgi:hypothetical protein
MCFGRFQCSDRCESLGDGWGVVGDIAGLLAFLGDAMVSIPQTPNPKAHALDPRPQTLHPKP